MMKKWILFRFVELFFFQVSPGVQKLVLVADGHFQSFLSRSFELRGFTLFYYLHPDLLNYVCLSTSSIFCYTL